MSVFDALQQSCVNTINLVFGDLATWTSSNTHILHSELCLYKSPNDLISIGQKDKYEYRPYNYSVEFYKGKFQGLKENVDSGIIEKITVKGVTIAIREVYTKFDGKTLTAYGELDG